MATGWNVMDALNNKTKAAAEDNKTKARFRTKDIAIKQMYSNDKNFYSIPDIEQLAQDILAVGLLENLTVVHDPCDRGEYRIIAGERRWRALTLLVEKGYEEFSIASCQIKTPAEEHEEMIQLIIANTYRNKTVADILEEQKTLEETLKYMKENGLTLHGYKLDSGRLRDVIANMMQVSSTKIGQIESINKKLIPEFTEELKEGRLTFSAAYEISKMSEDIQEDMLEHHREKGLTYKDVKGYAEEQKKAEEEQIDGQLSIEDVNDGACQNLTQEENSDQSEKEKEYEETEEKETTEEIETHDTTTVSDVEERQLSGRMSVEDFPEVLPEQEEQQTEEIKVELQKPTEEVWEYLNAFARKFIKLHKNWFLENYPNRVMNVTTSPILIRREFCEGKDRTYYFVIRGRIAHINLFDDYIQLWSENNEYMGNCDWFYLAAAIQSMWTVVAIEEAQQKNEEEQSSEKVCDVAQSGNVDIPSEPETTELYEEVSEKTDIDIAREENQKAWMYLEMAEKEFGQNDIRVRKQKILVAALAGYIHDLDTVMNPPEEPEQPELPKFKNNDQRKEWLRNYKDWGLWYTDRNIDVNYYKYDFADGSRLVVAEYLDRINAWNGREKEDEHYFHLLEKNKKPYAIGKPYDKQYMNATDSETYLVEFLKNLQKNA